MSHEPTPESSTAAGTEFTCKACGGPLEYDAARGTLACTFCGATEAIEAKAEGTVVEYDLEHGLGRDAARGYGVALRSLSCGQCGAVVSYGGSATAQRCDFCGSPQVMELADSRNPLRPESVMPFAVDKAAATSSFRAWLGALWFRPSNLKQLAQLREITGMYVPYWAFDAAVHSDWSALAGYYYYVTETYTTRDEKGRSVQRQRSVRKVRWRPASGSRDDVYDDLLVCASKGLPRDLTQKLEPFDTTKLLPYAPSYLAGWKAEEYSVDLNGGWKLAVERIEQSQRQRCSQDVPGDTQQALRVSNQFAGERFKHLLLPIWIASYRYHDRPFQFLVNGQTGEVTGRAPYSAIKIALFSVAVGALLLVIFWFSQR
jgi:hypothetical protein